MSFHLLLIISWQVKRGGIATLQRVEVRHGLRRSRRRLRDGRYHQRVREGLRRRAKAFGYELTEVCGQVEKKARATLAKRAALNKPLY